MRGSLKRAYDVIAQRPADYITRGHTPGVVQRFNTFNELSFLFYFLRGAGERDWDG
jgi:hypothetical protein